jgi:hypothetical protein
MGLCEQVETPDVPLLYHQIVELASLGPAPARRSVSASKPLLTSILRPACENHRQFRAGGEAAVPLPPLASAGLVVFCLAASESRDVNAPGDFKPTPCCWQNSSRGNPLASYSAARVGLRPGSDDGDPCLRVFLGHALTSAFMKGTE